LGLSVTMINLQPPGIAIFPKARFVQNDDQRILHEPRIQAGGFKVISKDAQTSGHVGLKDW
jgi:hypothetical protein